MLDTTSPVTLLCSFSTLGLCTKLLYIFADLYYLVVGQILTTSPYTPDNNVYVQNAFLSLTVPKAQWEVLIAKYLRDMNLLE